MGIAASCDVCVIGGGPGGSTVASILAKKGFHVIVLESHKHPRKQIGESLLPHAWKYLKASGVAERIEREGFVVKSGGTVAWDDRIHQISFKPFGYKKPALHIERDRFDHILFQHAADSGAQLYEQCKATSVQFYELGAQVHYTSKEHGAGSILCAEVIDASGQSGQIAKAKKLRVIDQDFRFISFWARFQNAKFVDSNGSALDFDRMTSIAPTTFVTSIGKSRGWGWHIPLRKTTSVGLVLAAGDLPSHIDNQSSWFETKCRSIPILNQLLTDAQYYPGSLRVAKNDSYTASKYAGTRWSLVGDAGAFVDPIFSLGVNFALYSGCLAATAVDRSLTHPKHQKKWKTLYDRELTRRIRKARSIALPYYQDDSIHFEAYQNEDFDGDIEPDLISPVSQLTHRPKVASEWIPTRAALQGELQCRPLKQIAF